MQEQWLSIIEYARIFNISDMTVRRRIKSGRLKASLRDGKYFIFVSTDERGNLQKNPTHSPAAVAARPMVQSAPKTQSHDHLNVNRAKPAHLPPKSELSFEKMAVVKKHISQPSPSVSLPKPHQPQALVDGVSPKAIVELCQTTLARVAATEKRVESECQSRIHLLEERLKSKELEINQFRQQVEDLQLLVEILEKKRAP